MSNNIQSRFYLSSLADMKENIIIKIMKLMRASNTQRISHPQNPANHFEIIKEERGGMTLGLFTESNKDYITTARMLPIELMVNVLEVAEGLDTFETLA